MNTSEELVEDTLQGRRIAGKAGSCLVANRAGLELLHWESDVTNELEDAIRKIDNAIRADSATVGQFAGLDYVIGAYLVNAARHDSRRAIEFMNTVCAVLLREFIASLPVFFRKVESGYSFGVAPPREYVDFVKRKMESRDSMIAETAKKVASRLSV